LSLQLPVLRMAVISGRYSCICSRVLRSARRNAIMNPASIDFFIRFAQES
jgi:hypothetical protein